MCFYHVYAISGESVTTSYDTDNEHAVELCKLHSTENKMD